MNGRRQTQLTGDVWSDFPRVGGLILNEIGVASLPKLVTFWLTRALEPYVAEHSRPP